MWANSTHRNSYDYDSNEDELEPLGTHTRALESIATFRIIKKKKKPSQGVSSASIVGLGESSDITTNGPGPSSASRSLTREHAASSTEFTFPTHKQPTHSSTQSRPRLRGDRELYIGSFENQHFDTDPTPTQARFDSAVATLIAASSPSKPGFDCSTCELSDTQPAKDRTELVMSQLENAFKGQDAFDSVDWDPDLPSAFGPDSPEPVAIKPQPVAYTTVGSLVDPNMKPQFSAPNRIQREGVRQPLMSMLNRSNDSFYQPRGPPPPLSMANSMAYAQQIAQSPINASKQGMNLPEATRGPRLLSSLKMPELTTTEEDILKQFQRPQVHSGNTNGSPATGTPSSASKLSAVAPSFGCKLDFNNNQTLATAGNTFGRSIAIEGNLPAGSVLNTTIRAAHDGTNGRRTQVLRDVSKFQHAFSKLHAAHATGSLDKQYQFPPPGLQTPSVAQANPLFGAHSSSALQSQAPSYRAAPPGYPQPLTAGPPGQRQLPITSNRQAGSINSIENIWADPSSAYSNSGSSNLQIESAAIDVPWPNTYPPTASNVYSTGRAQLPQGVLTAPKAAPKLNDPIQPKVIVDTLPPDAVAKYYPYLIPADMTGKYTPLSEHEQKKLDAVTWTAGQRAAQKARDLDDWFYMGQRRYATMDGADFVNELEDRQRLSNISYGPIAPPKKIFPPGPAIQKEITPRQIESMSVSDATKPLLDAAFGTYLAYAETGPSSRKYLSSFIPSPKWQIDDTDNGNQSCFGEDWGAPPKRFGRDIRRHGNY